MARSAAGCVRRHGIHVGRNDGTLSNYNEEQVEMLKKELIGTLKNAANMRGLAPAEFVNIAVFGQANSAIYSMQLPVEGESGGVKYSVNGKGYLKVADAGMPPGAQFSRCARRRATLMRSPAASWTPMHSKQK